MKKPGMPFYVQPQLYYDIEKQNKDNIWYKKERVGEKTLAKFMKRILLESNVTTDKKITNTSARKTMIQTLMKHNVPPTEIMQKSGHKRVSLIKLL
jgi:hypothetical protein